jgi:nitric oxide reductase subunit B
MAVGFWNFIGAGVFGFPIDMPIVSYHKAGTMLTPNHGHAALMGTVSPLSLKAVWLTMKGLQCKTGNNF